MSQPADGTPRVIALAGGKGGVGTSLLAANLAIHLARQGRDVVLMDLAPGGAAVHTQIGIQHPGRNLSARLTRRPPPLAELLVPGGSPNLKLLAGVPDWFLRPSRDEFAADLLREAESLPCQVVIADVGGGQSSTVQMACRAARTVLMVTTPEPNALTGVLRLQASILFGVVEETLGVRRAASLRPTFAEQGLRAVLAELKSDTDVLEKVTAAVLGRTFGFILNQTRSTAEIEAATRVGAVLSMLQAVIIDPVLTLEYDLSALQVAGERRVLSQRFPNSPVSRGLEKLAYSLLSAPADRYPARGGDRYAPLSSWHHYRLLALDPRASSRDVQRHYDWIRAPFQPGGEAEAVAARPHLDDVLARVEAAYRTLVFLENRREYDRQMVGQGVMEIADLRNLESEPASESGDRSHDEQAADPVTVSDAAGPVRTPAATDSAADETKPRPAASKRPSRSGKSEPSPAGAATQGPAPEVAPPGRYTGGVLRALREKRRMEIERIATITKIRAPQIEALEDDRYPDLPVPVFLRGFLKAYARCLDLDPERVVKDYMEGYENWRGAAS